jgi:cellulose synthase/poly-beta-1,6-N-acetylglucosamine synthase-like glycosyltransferase
MIYVFIVILFVYIATISLLIYGFDKIETVTTKDLQPKTNFSIVVPFRNEEKDFLNFLNSVTNLNYPKNLFEIIVVNDDSDDNSVAIFNKWQSENPEISSRLLQNIRKSNSPKKDAIQTAISQIKNEWIITTDADCVVNRNWLLAYDNSIQTRNVEMIVGSVSISNTKGFLNYFQFVDLLSLQGTTIGSFGIKKPFMCNGANFAYTKKLFLELNGFEGNNKIASGDDVLLLQKTIKLFPEKVTYLKNKDAIVHTNPEGNWSKLFQQRVRWASKTGSYDGFFGKFLAVIVLITNLVLLFAFCLFIFTNLPFAFCLLPFILKLTIDLTLLNKTNLFIGNQKFIFPVISSLFYPFFCISVAFYSFFGSFEWKNRKFKK